MSRRYQWLGVAAGVVLTFAATGCKPTERNYKAAYDAATAARQEQVDLDADLIPEGGLIMEGTPVKRTIDGHTVNIQHEPLTLRIGGKEPEDKSILKRYNVVVAVFKMPTNGRALAADLQRDGYEAFVAAAGQDKYYTIAGSYNSFDEAATAAEAFEKKHKDYHYVGLTEGIVVVEATNVAIVRDEELKIKN